MKKATRNNFNSNPNVGGMGAGKPVVETLEDRRLMSSVNLVDGMLIVEGKANGLNRLSVTPDGNGTTLFARANDAKAHYRISEVKSIRIIGGEKQDKVLIESAIKQNAYIRVGAGADSVVAGSGNDTVFGGGDGDTLRGAAGDDLLIGGAGKDKIDPGAGDNPNTINTKTNLNFKVAVASFTLVDATTNKTIGTLINGSTLNLAKLPDRINVIANVTGGTAESVSFDYDGQHVRVENQGPFALAADDAGDYYKWSPKAGVHTLSATPFSADNAGGNAGTAKTITFNVISDATQSGGLLGDEGTNTGGNTGGSTGGNTGGTNNNGGGTTVDVNGPTPVITVMDATVQLGQAIHVNGLQSNLKAGDMINAKFEWDFGDATGAHNTLTGFNAAHAYDKKGTYTITLKVTNNAGKSNTITSKVTVTDAERRFVYVSPTGNDANTGRTTTAAVKTFARALQLVGDNTEVLFNRGSTFDVKNTMDLGHDNVVVGAYGTGTMPVLKWASTQKYSTIFTTMGGNSVTVRDLAFDASSTASEQDAVRIGGENVSVRGCEFRNVGYAINNNGEPTGVLLMDNKTTSTSSIHSYFAWVQGSDFTIVGNKVHDSQHEHNIRIAGADRVLIAQNDLSNQTNSNGAVKGTITAHCGNYIYIGGNTLKNGALGLGPLDGGAGMEIAYKRLKNVVVDSDLIESALNIGHGTEHVMVRNNVIKKDNAAAIDMPGYSSEYKRGISDVYIVNNTVINNGTGGKFLKVGGPVTDVTVRNNLYVAPKFTTGSADAAPMQIRNGDLSGFRVISDNVWPMPTILAYADGGINFVGTKSGSTAYKTPAEWEAYSQVKHDQYKDVTLSTSWKISLGGITAGSSMKKAA